MGTLRGPCIGTLVRAGLNVLEIPRGYGKGARFGLDYLFGKDGGRAPRDGLG